jgi:hypothetical protein
MLPPPRHSLPPVSIPELRQLRAVVYVTDHGNISVPESGAKGVENTAESSAKTVRPSRKGK